MAKKKLPNFEKMSDKEIAKFWDTHDSADYWDQLKDEKPFVKTKKRHISIRLDEDLINNLKAEAKNRGIGYQTYIRMILKESTKSRKKAAS